VDEDRDYEDWDYDSLEDRVGLIWDFDTTINTAISLFVEYCRHHRVVEQDVLVSKTIKVAEEVG
jgi:hypothetical protein